MTVFGLYGFIDFLGNVDYVATIARERGLDFKSIPSFPAAWINPAILVVGFLLIYVSHRARESRRNTGIAPAPKPSPVSQIPPASEGWLEARLVEAGFLTSEVHAHSADCLRFLHAAGLFSQSDVLSFIRDQRCRDEIQTMYREELHEPNRVLEAYGYCHWGPRLHRAVTSEDRAVARVLLRQQIRDHLDPETGHEMTRERQIVLGLAKPPRAVAEKPGAPAREITILSPKDGDYVPATATVSGKVDPAEAPLQVFVLSRDNLWHLQPPVSYSGRNWRVQATFGKDPPSGTEYRIVAIAGEAGRAKTLPQLPPDLPRSAERRVIFRDLDRESGALLPEQPRRSTAPEVGPPSPLSPISVLSASEAMKAAIASFGPLDGRLQRARAENSSRDMRNSLADLEQFANENEVHFDAETCELLWAYIRAWRVRLGVQEEVLEKNVTPSERAGFAPAADRDVGLARVPLINRFRTLVGVRSPESSSPTANTLSGVAVTQLSEAAKQLMGASNPEGVISVVDWSSPPTVCIQQTSRAFKSEADHSLRTRYVEAVQDLVAAGLVVEHDRTNFHFTTAGWDLYRALQSAPMPPDVKLSADEGQHEHPDSVAVVRNFGGTASVSARIKIVEAPQGDGEYEDYQARWIKNDASSVNLEAGVSDRIKLAECRRHETGDSHLRNYHQVRLIGSPAPYQWLWDPRVPENPFAVTVEVELQTDPPTPTRRWARFRIAGRGNWLSTALVASGD